MNHEIFEELVAADALDVIIPNDREVLEAHFVSCAACQEMKKSFAEVVGLIPESIEARVVPAHVKTKIFSRINALESSGQARPRPWYLWTFALAAIALLAIMVPQLLKNHEVGRLTEIQGQVLIDGKPVTSSTRLKAGQRLATLASSSVELHLGGNALCKVNADSDLSVKIVNDTLEIHLNRGATTNLVKPGTKYAVITSVLKTEAKGTGFFVKTKGADQGYVCICTGHIVLSRQGFRHDLEATHHKAVFATKKEGQIQLEPGPMIDHTDEEGAQLVAHFK